MIYSVDWRSGFIGGKTTVKIGAMEGTLEEKIAEVLKKSEKLKSITILKIVKKRSSRSSFGVGQPTSSRDK